MCRLKSKKGEVVTLSLLAITGAVFAVGLLFRPIVDKVFPIFGGQQKQVTTQTTTVKPVMVKIDDGTEDGKWILAQKIDENVNNFKGDEKVTFGSWIKSLGFLWFIISLLSAGGVPIISVWYANIKKTAAKAISTVQTELSKAHEAHAGLTTEAKKIVLSVDAGLAEIDRYIDSAKQRMEAAKVIVNNAAIITDAAVRSATLATAQAALASEQTIYNKLIDLKADFKYAMYAEQDESTENLVKDLLKNDETNSKPATA